MLQRTYYGGAGQSTGDVLAVSGTILATGKAWFVDSVNGNNGNLGHQIDQAKQTLVATVAAASDGDIIFLLPGHLETLTSGLTLSKDVTIVGCGLADGKPSARIQCNGAGAQLVTASGKFAHIRHVRFLERADAQATSRLSHAAGALGLILDGCWFDAVGSSEPSALSVSSTAVQLMVRNTTFQSTATSVVTQSSIGWSGIGNVPAFAENVTLDNGEYGWSVQAWLVPSGKLRAELISMQYGANVALNSATTGFLHTLNEDGPGWINWPATSLVTYRPGLGAALGALLLTSGRITTTKRAIYVSSVIGDDTYSGFQRQRPKATLAAALTAATALSTTEAIFIVLAADHSETLTSQLSVADDQRVIVGEGSSNGEPTATIGFDGDGAQIVLVGSFCELRNIKFTANEQANTVARVESGARGNVIRDCVFECDEFDTVYAVDIEGVPASGDQSLSRVANTVFRSTQSDPALAPSTALNVDTCAGFLLEDITIDGGDSGFKSHAMEISASNNVHALNMKLLNGADIYAFDLQATDGIWIHFSDESESSYVRTEPL